LREAGAEPIETAFRPKNKNNCNEKGHCKKEGRKMKQKSKVSMIGALVLIISAVVLIIGCPQASKPTPAPAQKPEPEIEGVPWQCTYSTNSSWDSTILTLNGTTAIFKDPGQDAYSISCVIDKVNKKIKLVFTGSTDEYDYVIKESGSILEFSMNGVLKHKFKKL